MIGNKPDRQALFVFRFGCGDGLQSMKIPVSEKKRLPLRPIAALDAACAICNRSDVRASRARFRITETRFLHRF